VQEVVPDLAVVDLCRRRLQAVHVVPGARLRRDTAAGIHADMGLHPEIPVVALLRRRHLGIAGARLVLRRRRRVDDRRIHQRARAQRDPLVRQMRIHRGEERLRQTMPLQQVAEVEDRGLVGDAVVARLDPREMPHRLAIVEALLGHRIAQRIPVLQEIHPQHRFQRHRRAPALRPGLRVMRFDQREQPGPRHHRVHLGQERLPPRHLLLHRVAQARQGRLFRHRRGSFFLRISLSQPTQSARFFRRSLSISG
jgi:hypothetical protein